MVELAEILQAPVVDKLGRLNFPTNHYLNQTGLARPLTANADVILGLEITDMWGSVNKVLDLAHPTTLRTGKLGVKLIHIGVGDLYLKSNYQNFSRYAEVDLSIAGDAEATLPALIEEVRRSISKQDRISIGKRKAELQKAYKEMLGRIHGDSAYAENSNPVSIARLSKEIVSSNMK